MERGHCGDRHITPDCPAGPPRSPPASPLPRRCQPLDDSIRPVRSVLAAAFPSLAGLEMAGRPLPAIVNLPAAASSAARPSASRQLRRRIPSRAQTSNGRSIPDLTNAAKCLEINALEALFLGQARPLRVGGESREDRQGVGGWGWWGRGKRLPLGDGNCGASGDRWERSPVSSARGRAGGACRSCRVR